MSDYDPDDTLSDNVYMRADLYRHTSPATNPLSDAKETFAKAAKEILYTKCGVQILMHSAMEDAEKVIDLLWEAARATNHQSGEKK